LVNPLPENNNFAWSYCGAFPHLMIPFVVDVPQYLVLAYALVLIINTLPCTACDSCDKFYMNSGDKYADGIR